MVKKIMGDFRLELLGVSKRFGDRQANDSIYLHIAPGEVHGLVGENGAGKSTLINIVYGLLKQDEGSMIWEGEPCSIDSPLDARKLGIGIVMQHFSLFESMTVLENLYLHASLERRVTRAQLAAEAISASREFGFELNMNASVSQLSVGEQQRLEILRCLLQAHLKLLILDEPTAVLTPDEANTLMAALRNLADRGCSILYISHKLREITALADSASILRSGKLVTRIIPAQMDEDDIAALMMGVIHEPLTEEVCDGEVCNEQACSEKIIADEISAEKPSGKEILTLEHVSSCVQGGQKRAVHNLSLRVKEGEIVGIAGIAGNGQNTLLDLISGEQGISSGELLFDGEKIHTKNLSWRYRKGIRAVAAERLERSISITHSLVENLYLKTRLLSAGGAFFVNWKKMREQAQTIIEDYQVSCNGPDDSAGNLSGGNLQKFIMGRELQTRPKCLICHQPTWGVDLYSARFIRQKIKQLALEGTGVIIISEDLDELLALCDSLAVLHAGSLSEVRAVDAWTSSEIGRWMAGLQEGSDAA